MTARLAVAVVAALVLAPSALADTWLPHPANAEWTYEWTDTAYATTPTREKVTVKEQSATSFTLQWTTLDLGNPLSNEQSASRSSSEATGTFMLFERGTIMRISTGRYAGLTSIVRGGIGVKYSDFGGPSGVLGFPINDERDINAAGHDQQLFERGYIQWSDALGDFVVQTY